MKKRVADIIMSTLVERGITDCFAVVGGGAMYLDNALLHNKDMKKYFNHHEQACAMAAEAYTRSSGKLALVCVTSGPGGTNTLTGVMGAWVDSIPMIVISGQVRYAISVPKTGLNLRTRGVQEFNIVDTVKTMTKYSKLVIEPNDIKMEINKAIDIAMSGRRGPVWLDIPQDVQSAMVEESELTPYIKPEDKEDLVDIEFLHKELENSRRPVFLIGAGVLSSDSRELFRELLSKVQIPVVASFNGSDVLYREHPLCMGPVGPCGQRAANFTVQNSDLIISIGCSLGFSTTGFAQENFAPHAKLIAVDIDEDEQKKPGLNYYKQISCDAASFIKEIDRSGIKYTATQEWLDYCKKLKDRFSPFESAEGRKADERVCSYVFWKKFYEIMPENTMLILGNNSAITSALQVGNRFEKQHILTNYNCGSMGYDIPAALGVAVAQGREVVLATGDGSFMMNLQELQTIRHHDLPVKMMVFENQGYNAIRQTSKNFFNGELIGCTPETGVSFPDFKKVADTFGLNYIKCEKNKDVEDCLTSLLKSDGPTIMEVSQLIDDPVNPKVMSKKDENGRMMSPALHDMFPFIAEDEMKELMISQKEQAL
jgi:acetolactate synthase-1/2/3 large subunit